MSIGVYLVILSKCFSVNLYDIITLDNCKTYIWNIGNSELIEDKGAMKIPLVFLSLLLLLWRGTHWIIPLVCNCYAGSALFLSWQEAFTPVFNDSCHKCQDTRYFFRNFLAWSAGVLQPSVKFYSTSLLNLALYYYYQSKNYLSRRNIIQ